MIKNILITGATTGLGYDIFKELSKDNSVNLICVYKDPVKKKKMISSKKLIPIIQFLLNKDSDLLTGTIISATNLESKNNLN